MAPGRQSRTLSVILLLMLIAGAFSVVPFVITGMPSQTVGSGTQPPASPEELVPSSPHPESGVPIADAEADRLKTKSIDPPASDAAPEPIGPRIPIENIALFLVAAFVLLMISLRVDPNRWLILVLGLVMGCLFSCELYRGDEVRAMKFRFFAWEDILAAGSVIATIILRRRDYDLPLGWVIVGAVFLSFGWKMVLGYPWPLAVAYLMADVAVVFVPTGLAVFGLCMLMLMISALSGKFK